MIAFISGLVLDIYLFIAAKVAGKIFQAFNLVLLYNKVLLVK